MFERIGNGVISSEIDELVDCLGVKEEAPLQDFLGPLRKQDVQGCVQAIAGHLGLSVRVSLSYVLKGANSSSTSGFRSSELVNTDWTGRGCGSITAQVTIPPALPMFGTRDLDGYPIQVRVSENCSKHPETLVAIMAHELSHVLLESLRYGQHYTELRADLVPLLLGFRGVVQRGRKIVRQTTNGNVTSTHTTSFGYLTDSQFAFAYSKIKDILRRHQLKKNHFLELISQAQHKLKKAVQNLETFEDYLKYLDAHPPRRMRVADAQSVVRFHVRDYNKEWKDCIADTVASLKKADGFIQPLKHYTSNAAEQVKKRTQGLELTSERIGQVMKAIIEDVKISRKYVGFLYRTKRMIQRRRSPH